LSYLVDTNVLSELRKGERCDRAVVAWASALADGEFFISALTIGEIRRGIESIRRRDPKAAGALDSWLARIHATHSDRVIGVDHAIAEEWGRMSVPDPLPVVDGLLAATAQMLGLTLATRNVGDFESTGVPCVNPFAFEAS
jgi:predicted nucleic acid-binding protein